MAAYQNPVIVVPGITGTAMVDRYPLKTRELWTMVLHKAYYRLSLHPDNLRYEAREPADTYATELFSVYDEIIEALRYELSPKADVRTPVFAFPYDWRHSIPLVADELAEFIDEVLARTKLVRHYAGFDAVNKVDLVGHSMGGLIITEYLHHYGSEKLVGKVATIGTPFLGSLDAPVKIVSGMGALTGPKPSDREREAARSMPAVYQLTPSFPGAVVWPDRSDVDLFDPTNWQPGVMASLQEYVRLHSVSHHSTAAKQRKRAAEVLKELLSDARAHRKRVMDFNPASAGLGPKDWLAIVGVGYDTRLQMTVKKVGGKPRFSIRDEQYENRWEPGSDTRATGDGVVPVQGALPPFVDEKKLVAVCPKDFGFMEDFHLRRVAALHGLLTNMNLVQRLVARHFRPVLKSDIWGRPVPGVPLADWTPPIQGLRAKA